jgi:alanine-alpha-ketoisovalerate/valine-pyruvate aminotransferase
MRVFPGAFFKEKISSLVIDNFSILGTSLGKLGLPPTEIRIYLAVTLSTLPLASVSSISLGPANLANLL